MKLTACAAAAAVVAVLVGGVVGGGCSGSDENSLPVPSNPSRTSEGSPDSLFRDAVDDRTTATVEPPDEPPDEPTATPAEATAPRTNEPNRRSTSVVETDPPVVETFETVPETGVPGIESDDPFCRAWSEYAGSFAALAFAWDFRTVDAAARLEVAASGALPEAVQALADNLPEEIESERQAFTVDFPAPLLRRAERARDLLAQFGADDAAVAALGNAWIAAITDAGVGSEDLSVDVPAATTRPLAAAAERFGTERPPILEDPSLDTTDLDITDSLRYTEDNCPGQGVLAGNDEVSGDGV